MDYIKATEISAAAMTAQKARIEAATMNLANLHTSTAPGTAGYRPVTAVIQSAPNSFAHRFHNGKPVAPKAELTAQPGAQTRVVYEPGHPHANAQGMVSYPAIDPTQEMMTVMTALRAYEANFTALQVTKALAAKALEIGGQ